MEPYLFSRKLKFGLFLDPNCLPWQVVCPRDLSTSLSVVAGSVGDGIVLWILERHPLAAVTQPDRDWTFRRRPFCRGTFCRTGTLPYGHFTVRTLHRMDTSPWDFLPYWHFAVGCFVITPQTVLACNLLGTNLWYTVILFFYKVLNRSLSVQIYCLSSYRKCTIKNLSHFPQSIREGS